MVKMVNVMCNFTTIKKKESISIFLRGYWKREYIPDLEL